MDKPTVIMPHITGNSLFNTIPTIYSNFRDGYPCDYPFDESITDFESFRNEMISCVPYIKEKFANHNLFEQYSPDKYVHKEGLFYDLKN